MAFASVAYESFRELDSHEELILIVLIRKFSDEDNKRVLSRLGLGVLVESVLNDGDLLVYLRLL